MPWISGSEELERHSPIRRLTRSNVSVDHPLVFANPAGTLPIHGVHERLRALVEAMPVGAALSFQCRPAKGTHHYEPNLIAMAAVDEAEVLESLEALKAASAGLEALRPTVLGHALASPDPGAWAIYADQLLEAGVPYGEFLSRSRAGTKADLTRARALARAHAASWLGPLASLVDDVDYDRGVPITAVIGRNPVPWFDFAALTAHPMSRAFRRVLLKKSPKTRRASVLASNWQKIVGALVPLNVTELDASNGGLIAALARDCSRLTHLHDVDFDSRGSSLLSPEKLTAVRWIEVRVPAGASSSVLQQVAQDTTGFFGKLRPELSLWFHGGAAPAERARVEAMRAQLCVSSVSVDGEPVS